MTAILIIADEDRDLEVVTEAAADITHLNDFSYVNATSRTIGGELTDDLNQLAGLPSPLRQAGYRTIRTWLTRRDQFHTTHAAQYADEDRTTVTAAIAAWRAGATADAVADWDTSGAA